MVKITTQKMGKGLGPFVYGPRCSVTVLERLVCGKLLYASHVFGYADDRITSRETSE